MSNQTPPGDKVLIDRIVDLEILMTHMQEDFQKLNAAVLDQQQELAALAKSLQRLESKVDKLGDEPDSRDPLQERPPHY